MSFKELILAVLVLAFFCAGQVAAAETTAWSFDVSGAAGVQYDSSVGIEDLDANSGESDSIMLLSGGGSVSYSPSGQPFTLRLGYDYSGTSHRRFEEFDLDLHHGFAEVQYQNALIDAALAFDRYEGLLDGEDWVQITQVSPSIAHLFGDRTYVRAAWIASTRDYALLPSRNATKSAARIDTYVLLDGLERYFSISVQAGDEDANSSDFDYRGHQVGLAYTHTFEGPLPVKLKSSVRYEERDYGSLLPVIGERRRDQRWRARLEAEVPFSDTVSLHTIVEHTQNQSNADTAMLQKDVAGLELRVAF